MNIYEHVICFQKADGNDDTYYRAFEQHDALQAQKGDVWRWLAPKSITQGIEPENLSVVLVKPLYRPDCGAEVQVNAVRHTIGWIRSQQSEKYVDFSIWVGGLPSSGNYKQFAVQRANGQIVIGTFTGQQTSKAAYMQALRDFYESFPYTKVLCDVDGSKMRVRIWEKQGVFMLADEGLTVGLGKTTVGNENNPLITRISQGLFSHAAQDSYNVVIGPSIQEGNVFTLDNATYVAVAGDTSETVLEKLGITGRYKVPHGFPTQGLVLAGTRTISNTNKITVQAVYDSVLEETDRYLIRVTGTPQPGNVIQISATGKTTKSYAVATGDTAASIQNYFNVDGGYYLVDGGVIPQISFLAGVQRIDNANNPSLSLFDYIYIPGFQVSRWRIIIGSDVRAGNSFTLQAQTYLADDGDTALDVANFFGYDSVSFQMDTLPNVTPAAYATKGYLYNENNIADVTISEGPKLARSSQYILEAEFGCDIEPGGYQLALADSRNAEPEIVAFGNYVSVKTQAEGELFEVADYGDVYGFEYYENGFTQRLRLPVFLNPPKQQSEEDRVVKFMGGYRRTTTKFEYISKLVTRAAHLPMHVTIASFLKHEHLRIAEKVYYNAGEYAETHLSAGSDLRQATAELTDLKREKNNYSRYRSNYYQSGNYGGFFKVLGDGLKGRLQLWLRSSEIVREIEDTQFLNTGSYQLIAETFQNVNLSLYVNGSHYLTAFFPTGQRVRLSEYLRFETGIELIIKASVSDACHAIPIMTYACEHVTNPEIIYDCEKIQKNAFGEFTDDFNPDYTI